MATLPEPRRSPSRILALSWLAGMTVFVLMTGKRVEEQWAADRRAAPVEDAGPDAGPPPTPWDDAGRREEELDYLLDDEEGGEEEDDAGIWIPPGEDAGDLLAATGDGGELADLGDDDGGDLADLDEYEDQDQDEEAGEVAEAEGEDGGGTRAAEEESAGSTTTLLTRQTRRTTRRAERLAAAARAAIDAGPPAAQLAASVNASSFSARHLGSAAVLALEATWPPIEAPAPAGKDDLAVRRAAPLDARSLGTAALRFLDGAWPVDEQASQLAATNDADGGALTDALNHESELALRARFRAVVPPLSAVRVLERDRRVVLRIGDAHPFESAESARLVPSAERDVARVAPVLAAMSDRRFRVIVPRASSAEDASAPEPPVDMARARSIARVLVRRGVLPSHLDWTASDATDRALASELAARNAGVAIVLVPQPPREPPEAQSAPPDAGHPAASKAR